MLTEAGRHARAFFSVVIAAEELAKAIACSRALAQDTDEAWEALWDVLKGSNRHVRKLGETMMLKALADAPEGTSLQAIAGVAVGVARTLHDKKLNALYVDLEGASVRTPAEAAGDSIHRELTRALIREVSVSSTIARMMLDAKAPS